MAKVTFDGERQLIIVNPGVTDINVETDVYSEWKRWFRTDDNSKFPIAMRNVGGDELPEDQLGLTFFLLNDWKIRPYEGDHRLKIRGNLYKQDKSDPIADTVGNFKVTASMTVSNLINRVGTTGSASCVSGEVNLDSGDLDNITSQEEWTITAS